MSAKYQCYRCGESLDYLTFPWSRRDECRACQNHVHCCRMCRFFDAQATRQCLEDDAEDVKEKERVNFCEWFKPSENAFDPKRKRVEDGAHDQLASLFGDASPATDRDDEMSAAENLFRNPDKQ